MNLRDWAKAAVGGGSSSHTPELKQEAFPLISEKERNITVGDLFSKIDLDPQMRVWLEVYVALGKEWAEQNDPPGFVTDEACWEKGKRAAGHASASDLYVFANFWYHEHCG